MRRLAIPVSVVFAIVVLAPVASAEWFGDAYLGPAVTPSSTLTFTAFGEEQKQNLGGRSSPSFGLRFGRWLDNMQWPWLGVALDVSYFRPAIDVQTVPISLLLMARYPLLKDEEFPIGRLQPYVALGPGLFISNVSGTLGFQEADDTTRDIGLDVRVGAAYLIDGPWAAFTEYRFTHFSPSFDVKTFGGGTASSSTTFNTHHVVLGISYRF
jgi:opacity protein-like surface antigen